MKNIVLPRKLHQLIQSHRVQLVAIFTTLLFCGVKCLHADGLADQAHSLKLVPADAAVYSASLRVKEQWDNFINSKAYARLMQIPTVQTVKMLATYQLQQSPEPTIAAMRDYLASPQGKDALAVVTEMMSDEIFAYGSADLAELFDLTLRLNAVNRSSQLQVTIGEEKNPADVAKRIREFFNEHKEKLKLADGVIGFRIRDRQRAGKQLEIIEAVLKQALQGPAPEIAARLKRETIAGHPFLTLRLDGSMLPWEKLREEATDVDAGEFEKWKALVIDKTVVAALGVFDDFVILSVGDSTEHLEKLGRGPLLVDTPAFARLAKHADQRVASIGYAGGDFMKKANSPRRSLDDAASTVATLLQQAELKPELRDKLIADSRSFLDRARQISARAGRHGGDQLSHAARLRIVCVQRGDAARHG